jgi:hypothetical protein
MMEPTDGRPSSARTQGLAPTRDPDVLVLGAERQWLEPVDVATSSRHDH